MQPASVENAADFFKDSKLHLIFIELGTTHKSTVQTNGVLAHIKVLVPMTHLCEFHDDISCILSI